MNDWLDRIATLQGEVNRLPIVPDEVVEVTPSIARLHFGKNIVGFAPEGLRLLSLLCEYLAKFIYAGNKVGLEHTRTNLRLACRGRPSTCSKMASKQQQDDDACDYVDRALQELPLCGLTTVYADARVWLYIRSACVPLPRNPMILAEFRPSLSGKQSEENPDTSRLFNLPSELPYLGSK